MADIASAITLDITAYQRKGLNLISSYWTPDKVGEVKHLIFMEITPDSQTNEDTGEVKILPTAVFIDPVTSEVWRNASARLIGGLERHHITKGTLLEITYTGKIKNTTNAFSSDNWSVFILEQITPKP